ncbi:MAG: phage holin family protein [Candidatus Pacearchaeota archaeon]
MKSIARNIVFYASSLFILSQFLEGVRISGGIPTYIFGGAVLSLIFLIIKPVLNIISIPLNILTLGLFSFFSNIIILYLLTVFVPDIKIKAFQFQGYSFSGFIIPEFYFNTLMAYVISSFMMSVIVSFLTWLIKK